MFDVLGFHSCHHCQVAFLKLYFAYYNSMLRLVEQEPVKPWQACFGDKNSSEVQPNILSAE